MDKILVPTLRVSFGVVNGPSPRGIGVTGLRRQRPFPGSEPTGKVRPDCDIGRAGSGRPLPDPTADLGTLSVQEQKSDGPDPFPASPVSAGSSPPILTNTNTCSELDKRPRLQSKGFRLVSKRHRSAPRAFMARCLTCRPRQRSSGAKKRRKLISKRWLSASF
jgi:hypothetical protein